MVLPLRRSAPSSRNTTGCSSWFGASPDPASPRCSSAADTLGLRPRQGGAGSGDQGGMDDRAPSTEVSLDGLKDLFPQRVLLQQVAESQDCDRIGDPVTDQLDTGKAAPVGHLDQGFCRCRIDERVPLQQQIDVQQCGQRIGRPAAFLAGLGVVRLDQVDQRLPGHHHFHLREKLLPFGLFLGRSPRSQVACRS